MHTEHAAKLVAGALLVGASLLSGNAALITAAGGVGVNWSSEALGELWRTALPLARPDTPLVQAYERALRRAVTELRRQYQVEYGKQAGSQAFALVSECSSVVAQAEYPNGISGAMGIQQALVSSLDALLYGHDARQVAWIKERLLAQAALAFQHELASDPVAWRLFHGWLIQQISNTTVALGQALHDLPRVLGALRDTDKLLAAIDDITERLEATIAGLRDEMRRIAASGVPGASPTRSHQQTIGDNAHVSTAISGDVHGNITSSQHFGGVNLGSGNTIESMGDVVAGNKIVYSGRPDPLLTHGSSLQQQLDAHRARMGILEHQRAIFGFNTRPEIILEIEAIRAEIDRLESLLRT